MDNWVFVSLNYSNNLHRPRTRAHLGCAPGLALKGPRAVGAAPAGLSWSCGASASCACTT